MNEIKKFYDNLPDVIDTGDIKVEVMHTVEAISTIVLPMFAITDAINLVEIKVDAIGNTLQRGLKQYKRNIPITLQATLKQIVNNEKDILDLIDESFGEEVAKITLDYAQINLLRYIEVLDHVMRFSKMWLIVLIDNMLLRHDFPTTTPISRYNKEWLNDRTNVTLFISGANAAGIPFDEYWKTIKGLKGHSYINDNSDIIHTTTGRRVDPPALGLIPPRFKLSYQLGRLLNTWRVSNHARNKEELIELRLKVLALKEQAQSPDLSKEEKEILAKNIKYRSEQVNRISGKIEAMEESV